jgi:hypothetical protein
MEILKWDFELWNYKQSPVPFKETFLRFIKLLSKY